MPIVIKEQLATILYHPSPNPQVGFGRTKGTKKIVVDRPNPPFTEVGVGISRLQDCGVSVATDCQVVAA